MMILINTRLSTDRGYFSGLPGQSVSSASVGVYKELKMKESKNKHDADKYYRNKRHGISRCETIGELIAFCENDCILNNINIDPWKKELNSKFKGNLIKSKDYITSIINEMESNYWATEMELCIDQPSPEEMKELKEDFEFCYESSVEHGFVKEGK